MRRLSEVLAILLPPDPSTVYARGQGEVQRAENEKRQGDRHTQRDSVDLIRYYTQIRELRNLEASLSDGNKDIEPAIMHHTVDPRLVFSPPDLLRLPALHTYRASSKPLEDPENVGGN